MSIFTDDGKEYESEAHLVLGEHVGKYDEDLSTDAPIMEQAKRLYKYQDGITPVLDERPEIKPIPTKEYKKLEHIEYKPDLSEAGNIDPYTRPMVNNPDGSVSTVRSMSFNRDGQEILIPTVAHDGSGILSDDAAIAQYDRSGLHLGKFATPEEATAFAEQYHKDQEKIYGGDPFERAASRLKASTTPSGGRTEGLATKVPEAIAQGVIGTVGKMATLPGRVASGQVDMSSKEGVDEAIDLGFNLVAGGLGTAPLRTSGLGIFGGRMTPEAVALAERLEAKGVSERSVKEISGLERGADQKWRLEISDDKAVLNPNRFETIPSKYAGIRKIAEKGASLEQVLDHPELYKRYPELRDLQVFTDSRMAPFRRAEYQHDDFMPHIRLNTKNAQGGATTNEEMKANLIHEIQHAIQYKEGFSILHDENLPKNLQDEIKGVFIRKFLDEHPKGQELKDLLLNFAKRSDLTAEEQASATKAAEEILKKGKYGLYASQAHEVEARNAADRMNLSARDRKLSLATDTEDLPRRLITYE